MPTPDIKAKNIKAVHERLVKAKEKPNARFIDPAAANCVYNLLHKVCIGTHAAGTHAYVCVHMRALVMAACYIVYYTHVNCSHFLPLTGGGCRMQTNS